MRTASTWMRSFARLHGTDSFTASDIRARGWIFASIVHPPPRMYSFPPTACAESQSSIVASMSPALLTRANLARSGTTVRPRSRRGGPRPPPRGPSAPLVGAYPKARCAWGRVRRDHQPPSARRRPGPLVLQLLERNPAAALDLAKSSFRALERTVDPVEQRRDVARIRIGFVERRGQQ